MVLFRHVLSILVLPFTVTVVVPGLVLRQDWSPAPVPLRLAGIVVAILGLILVASTIRDFARRGRGTLAPWDPPRHLVVSGIYRYVRNPMITGVILVLVGEAFFFGSVEVGIWAALVLAVNAIYIPVIEEKGLYRRFGDEYERYTRHVPRWLPRSTPWEPDLNRRP